MKSLLLSIVDYICSLRLFDAGHFGPAFFVIPSLTPEPLSDAELKECKAALSPLGYIAIKNTEDSETVIYRQKDWDEQEKSMELILQQLRQDVL